MSSLVNYIIWLLPSYNSWDAMEEAGSRVFTRSHSKTLFTWLSVNHPRDTVEDGSYPIDQGFTPICKAIKNWDIRGCIANNMMLGV